jgi:hypothetical protein
MRKNGSVAFLMVTLLLAMMTIQTTPAAEDFEVLLASDDREMPCETWIDAKDLYVGKTPPTSTSGSTTMETSQESFFLHLARRFSWIPTVMVLMITKYTQG